MGRPFAMYSSVDDELRRPQIAEIVAPVSNAEPWMKPDSTIEGLHEAVNGECLTSPSFQSDDCRDRCRGLLPIMCSTRTGAEAMKPLATPVLSGMVNSLLHVLIVTPVIFSTIREREVKRQLSLYDDR